MLRRSFLKALAGLFVAAPAIRSVVPAKLPNDFERTFIAHELDDVRFLLGMVGRLNEDPFEGYTRHEIQLARIDAERIGPRKFKVKVAFRRVDPIFATYYLQATGETYHQLAVDVYGSTTINRPGLMQMVDDRPGIFGRLFRARSA